MAAEQVRRDHLISHALAALAPLADRLIFFGGTALARTFLSDGRLSEDIDLIAVRDRNDVAAQLTRSIESALRVEFGRVRWTRPLREVRDIEPVSLVTDDGMSVRIQLLRAAGYPQWPTESTALHQRYSDAAPIRLVTPTRPAFAAWKTVTWCDRAAPRDLWDLWALAQAGAIDADAAALYRRFGPTNGIPQPWMFATAPEDARWREELAGQTRLTVSAADALARVRDAWIAATI